MLPPDVGDFTGRSAERAAITAALAGRPEPGGAMAGEGADGVVPIAALNGQGGVGKTTLAVHAAHRFARVYPDGQLFANLAGAQAVPAEPEEVVARFLRALGVAGRAVPDAGEKEARCTGACWAAGRSWWSWMTPRPRPRCDRYCRVTRPAR